MQQRTPEEYKAAYEHHRKSGNDAKAARVAQLYREHMAQQPKPKDGAFEGFGDAFKRGIDQPLENFGTTAKVLGAENLGQSLQDAVDAPPGQSASSQFMNADKDGSFAYRYLPKAAVEQAGQFAGSLISRAGGAALGGAVGSVPGAVIGGLAGPMLFEAVQQLGPIALERAKNNGRTEPNREDFIYAAGTSAGVGALNAIAPGASGKIKRMLLEGVTEGTQSVGEQTGSTINTQKGLEVDPRQALAEGIIGGSSAGLVDTSISTVTAATNLVRGSGNKSTNKKTPKQRVYTEGDTVSILNNSPFVGDTLANQNEIDNAQANVKIIKIKTLPNGDKVYLGKTEDGQNISWSDADIDETKVIIDPSQSDIGNLRSRREEIARKQAESSDGAEYLRQEYSKELEKQRSLGEEARKQRAASQAQQEDEEAQASLAQRLSDIAAANNYDLNDIDRTSTNGARETVDAAHVQYTEELRQLFNDLKDRVKVTDTDSLSVVQKKILAKAAYREGKNKTKNKVGAQEMAALDKLAGDTYEGQQAMSLLRQLNQLTQMHNDGYKGGASRLTDQFAPFGLGGEGYDSSRANAEQVLRPLLTGGLASVTGGASLIPQAAAYGTGRMIDKITGNRSKLNSFVSDNVGNEGIKVGSHPNPESLRERRREEAQAAQEAELAAQAAAEQRAADKRESNLKSVRNNDPANPGSPQGIVELGTALDRNGVAQVLRIMKGNPNTTAYERKMIEDYETSVATGGYIDYDIVRKINGIVDNNPQLKPLMGNRVRNQGAVNQAAQQQLSQKDANYQRGIENNKAFAQQLQDALTQDSSVLPIHKAHLGEALNQMQLDLGAAPVKRLKAIEDRLAEKGVPTEAAAKYFAPYVERVVAQQEAKADRDATAAALDEDPINDARIVPVPRGNERMQQIFGVNEPGEGGNYIDLDSKEDLTGNTYTGGVVKIIDGKPLLETNDAPAAPATKESGNKVKVNLFKQKAGWKWIDYDGPETIVSTHQGSKHHYSLSSGFETPVTLQTYPKQPSEPRLRPTSQGKVVLGNKIGSISVRGKVHPVYDQVTIVDKRDQEDPVNDSREPGTSLDLGDLGSNPMRVSPSVPTAVKATHNALTENLQIGLPTINSDPKFVKKMAKSLRPYTPLEEKGSRSPAKFLEQAIESYKQNLMTLFNSVSPEYRERAKQWYVGANKLAQEAAEKFGVPLEAASAVFASLSPQQDWYVNYDIGMRLMDIYVNHQDTAFDDVTYKRFTNYINAKNKKGNYVQKQETRTAQQLVADDMRGKPFGDMNTVQQGFFVRFWDEQNNVERGHMVVTPEGGFSDYARTKSGAKVVKKWNSFSPIRKSIEILNDPSRENISNQLGGAHKVRSFYNNILDPHAAEGDVTIDTHAIAAALLRPLSGSHKEVIDNFSGAGNNATIGAYGSYGIFAEAYRRAAAEAGVEPREMQSIAWEAVRGLFPAAWKAQQKNQDSINAIWNDVKTGKITADTARRKVYETAGNIRPAQWEEDRPSFGISEGTRTGSNPGELSGVNVPGRDGRRGRGDAAGVLSSAAGEVDPVNNSVEAAFARVQRDYLEPTPTEIKEKLPEAEDLVQFTIGKKGSSYEEGITSEADIRRIADLLDITISIVNEKGAIPGVISADSRGNYAGKRRGTRGEINVRGPKVVGKSQYIATLLHEVSHGLEGQTLDGEEANYNYAPSPHPKGSKKFNADTFRHGSFREHMHYVLKLAKGDDIYGEYQPDVSHLTLPDYDEAVEIRKEIDAIQADGTGMRFPGFAPGALNTDNLLVRPPIENYIEEEARREAEILSGQKSGPDFDTRFKKSKTGMMKNVGRPFIRYTKDVAEFSVDPLIVYLQDPQMMKLIAPTTSKYIQKVYNKANMPVKFYSSPLVAVMAILLAGLAKGMGGEEEEQQPGALSMQPGLLTT